MSQTNNDKPQSRVLLIASGILFILVGFAAMSLPVLFTAVIVRILAIFILVSGVISLAMAIIGKQMNYRLLEILSGIIRIAAGIVLLSCLKSGALVITMAFAIYLVVEGVFVIAASLRMWITPGWVWTLFNGITALALGILVYRGWPSSSFSVLGYFFGINLVLKGAAQFALGFAPRPAASVVA
ncbi:MAG: hypothetical protein RLZZ214_799 [Verrucomicrobiota bacterium]|jgi:uncharacterized membrane protein HdeD (DUF308 family)